MIGFFSGVILTLIITANALWYIQTGDWFNMFVCGFATGMMCAVFLELVKRTGE